MLLPLKSFKTEKRAGLDLNVIMMTGMNHINLSRASVLSIAKTWKRLPRLTIISDGSMNVELLQKKFAFWRGELNLEHWKETEAYHAGKTALLNYAAINPFGKKMAIILRFASLYPIIWIDSDILFFKDFTQYIPANSIGDVLGGMGDWRAAYDDRLLKLFNNDLHQLKKFNAGLIYASGSNFYEKYGLEAKLSAIHPKYDFLSEQTIFAQIASESLGVIWDETIIGNHAKDTLSLTPTSEDHLVGRHYTSDIRQLFWRDAFLKSW
ncbi:biotin carboxylase domain-containing protein [Pedobacter sandarakinus]|uniref:hypothetical protein n=1 Tax=Pedobacter sandarakinus TaxID=353156 RepID=UPI002246A2F0|nr:hypothetical protein [Pedobacter sandarakinus]MCX2575918.1 hypothetical protein [Pedobacter sandarakinus]